MIQDSLSRISGILLHPTSLPSPYGIGDLGEEAYAFIDFLQEAGQHIWQILPLTHTGYGDSPYQGFSAFAGQPLLISPSRLRELGLVAEEDLAGAPMGEEEHIDYGEVIAWKTALLRTAHKNFLTSSFPALQGSYEAFCAKNSFWLSDYALFMACKAKNEGKSWLLWEDSHRLPSPEFKEILKESFQKEILFYQFIQFLFFEQWFALKAYANERGVSIIGDIPIFVSMDSADVWANPRLFRLDERGYPTHVAGVPPDYFSETGQLWGNPLYDWAAHEEEGYRWWIRRIKSQLELSDVLRIDHFRGFEACWAVPFGEETAVNGEWKKAPGYSLFRAVEKALGSNLPIIAEDLGVITPEVEALRDTFRFPGMKVLQFAFETTGESPFLPHQFHSPGCICYTGTHDNDTTKGWFETLREECRKKALRYMDAGEETPFSRAFIRLCLSSVAARAVFPLQDLLDKGKEGRMNTPGTAFGNWAWRFPKGALTPELASWLREVSVLYGRY